MVTPPELAYKTQSKSERKVLKRIPTNFNWKTAAVAFAHAGHNLQLATQLATQLTTQLTLYIHESTVINLNINPIRVAEKLMRSA